MKVLFVYPNILLQSRIPISLSIMIAITKNAGHEAALFDTTFMHDPAEEGLEDDAARHATFQVREADLTKYGVVWDEVDILDELDACLKRENPDLVAITATENMWSIAKKVGHRCRRKGLPVIVGGILPTAIPETIIEEDWIDMLCVGEGEALFPELLDYMQKGKDYRQLKNLWVRDKKGKIHRNTLRGLVQLDENPRLDWDLFSKRHWYRPIGGVVYRTGNFMLSRGCAYACSYCNNNQLHDLYDGLGKYHREVSVDRAIDELAYLTKKYKVELIQFQDEIFLLMSKKRIKDLMTAYKEKVGIPFSIGTHPYTMNEFAMKHIVDAGCINLSMSIESGSDKIRKEIFNRRTENHRIIRAFEIAKSYGIRVSTSNVIGNPTETRDQIFETINLNRACNPDSANVNFLYPYRGTEAFRYAVKNKLFDPNLHKGDGGVRIRPVLNLPQITDEELMGIQRVFQFYLRFPEEVFPKIERAEKSDEEGNRIFEELATEFREKYSHCG